MEYCEAGSLQDLINEHLKLGTQVSESYIWTVWFQLASALSYCHLGLQADRDGLMRSYPGEGSPTWRPVLHRDIKPANVFLANRSETAMDSVKLGDFGLGYILQNEMVPETYVGIAHYLAPEISRMSTRAIQWTEHCDIFSLGCTIYALCALKPPFDNHMETEQEKYLPLPQNYSKRLRDLITSCLSFYPQIRPNALRLFRQIKEQIGVVAPSVPTMSPEYGHDNIEIKGLDLSQVETPDHLDTSSLGYLSPLTTLAPEFFEHWENDSASRLKTNSEVSSDPRESSATAPDEFSRPYVGFNSIPSLYISSRDSFQQLLSEAYEPLLRCNESIQAREKWPRHQRQYTADEAADTQQQSQTQDPQTSVKYSDVRKKEFYKKMTEANQRPLQIKKADKTTKLNDLKNICANYMFRFGSTIPWYHTPVTFKDLSKQEEVFKRNQDGLEAANVDLDPQLHFPYSFSESHGSQQRPKAQPPPISVNQYKSSNTVEINRILEEQRLERHRTLERHWQKKSSEPAVPSTESIINPNTKSVILQKPSHDNVEKHGRQHGLSNSLSGKQETVSAYVRNLTVVNARTLKSILTQYGRLAYFNISRPMV